MSFYGGKEGKPFQISKIFHNIQELNNDLKGNSDVKINNYVLISYGDDNYTYNYKIDYQYDGKNYNNTLWKKVFYLNGETPPLNSDKILTNGNIHYIFITSGKLKLPKTTIITDKISSDQLADIEFIPNPSNNTGELHFKIPASQKFIDEKNKKANISLYPRYSSTKNPTIEINYDESDEFKEYPKLNLSLPNIPDFDVGTISTSPNTEPKIKIKTYQKDPEDINNDNLVYFELSLPRSSNFYQNDQEIDKQIGEFIDYPQILTNNFEKYKVGDYYLYSSNGALYYINNINSQNKNISLQYKVCLMAPLPKIAPLQFYPPYNDENLPNLPKVSLEYKNNAQHLDPYYTFQLPSIPTFSADYTSIDPEPNPLDIKVTEKIEKNKNIHLNFNIPRGARLYTGEKSPDEEQIESKNGDCYFQLNNSKAYFYKYLNNIWNYKGKIEGLPGEPIKIIGHENCEGLKSQEKENILLALNKYSPINTSEIVTINYKYLDDPSLNKSKYEQKASFWCYKLNEQWKIILLASNYGGTKIYWSSFKNSSPSETSWGIF